MPIVIKNPNCGQLIEYMMIEIQGDLTTRNDEVMDCSGAFVGDVFYNRFGNPILIIGHHIMFGIEKKLEKPFAVIEKVEKISDSNRDLDSQQPTNISILDSTVNIENRTETQIEYHVKAIIKKKLVFSQRPRPIISYD